MMNRYLLAFPLLFVGLFFAPENEWPTPFETSEGKRSATWEECIAWYQELDTYSPKIKVVEYANGTDVGKPLHLVVISKEEFTSAAAIKRTDKRIVLINNGIHPGEPDGIDASMMLARDLVTNPMLAPILDNVVICIIPVYNVDGALNRGCCSRANQNGPEAYGFRGNAQNLDLNRDFVKCDSRNAQTFNKIFTEWRPDVFIDTHVTDGADYQYLMTYITTQKDKLHPIVSDYMRKAMIPELENQMRMNKITTCVYVNPASWSNPPDSGLTGFLETPRYATGYSTLFNCIGLTSESHMLKNFPDRVWGTYYFLLGTLKTVNRDRVFIARVHKEADAAIKTQEEFPIRWKLKPTQLTRKINFQGYTARYKTSNVTGAQRLYYDRNAPYEKEIPLYDEFEAEVKVKKPVAYIIPQAYDEVIARLELNGVELKRLSADFETEVEVYTIESYNTSESAYEGHYAHRNTKVKKAVQKMKFYKGDYVVFCNQVTNRYIVETLEPEAHDSFFNWNFFDGILMQKEYFSGYLFEETAERLLNENPAWKTELEQKKQQDSVFAKSAYAQLDFIYKKSNYAETTLNRYPVGRLMNEAKLPLEK